MFAINLTMFWNKKKCLKKVQSELASGHLLATSQALPGDFYTHQHSEQCGRNMGQITQSQIQVVHSIDN